jgi:hypothetical protein
MMKRAFSHSQNDPNWIVPLTQTSIRNVSSYYPYIETKEDLPVVPFILDAWKLESDSEEEEPQDPPAQKEPKWPEFCFSCTFAPTFIDECIYLGYFPMALCVNTKQNLYVTGIKLHKNRCIMDLQQPYHVGKTVKKRYD